MSAEASPPLPNAGRYPALPSSAMMAILAAQYGSISVSIDQPMTFNAPEIVDRHHDIEAPGAPFPELPTGPRFMFWKIQHGDIPMKIQKATSWPVEAL